MIATFVYLTAAVALGVVLGGLVLFALEPTLGRCFGWKGRHLDGFASGDRHLRHD